MRLRSTLSKSLAWEAKCRVGSIPGAGRHFSRITTFSEVSAGRHFSEYKKYQRKVAEQKSKSQSFGSFLNFEKPWASQDCEGSITLNFQHASLALNHFGLITQAWNWSWHVTLERFAAVLRTPNKGCACMLRVVFTWSIVSLTQMSIFLDRHIRLCMDKFFKDQWWAFEYAYNGESSSITKLSLIYMHLDFLIFLMPKQFVNKDQSARGR